MKGFKIKHMVLQKGKRSLSEGIPLGRTTKATKLTANNSLAPTRNLNPKKNNLPHTQLLA